MAALQRLWCDVLLREKKALPHKLEEERPARSAYPPPRSKSDGPAPRCKISDGTWPCWLRTISENRPKLVKPQKVAISVTVASPGCAR